MTWRLGYVHAWHTDTFYKTCKMCINFRTIWMGTPASALRLETYRAMYDFFFVCFCVKYICDDLLIIHSYDVLFRQSFTFYQFQGIFC